MASGKRQHLVPQQMIKRFSGADGKLFELHKESLEIGVRRHSPKGILYLDDYYRDICSDFDNDILIAVEQKFAQYYPRIADHKKPEELCGDGGAVLIDWISAMLCRTQSLATLSQAIVQKELSPSVKIPENILKLFHNIIRSECYSEHQDILSRPQFKWRMKIFPEGCDIVITDNPVCQTNGLQDGGQATLVPLSKRLILIGGQDKAVEKFRNVTIDDINLFLFAWAYKSIYAAEKHTLESIKKTLDGIDDKERCEAARKPLFGMPERIKEKKIPSDINISQWYKDMKDKYGESILPGNPLT
jgi:hypothetical protein